MGLLFDIVEDKKYVTYKFKPIYPIVAAIAFIISYIMIYYRIGLLIGRFYIHFGPILFFIIMLPVIKIGFRMYKAYWQGKWVKNKIFKEIKIEK